MAQKIVSRVRRGAAFRTISLIAVVGVAVHLSPFVARAQTRGVYPVGMNATNSGVTPEAGLTYSNLFVFFSRDENKDAEGNVVATGQNSVLMDLNTFLWVSKKESGFLGGAIFSASATLPIANNSLTSDVHGSISGGGGLLKLIPVMPPVTPVECVVSS